MSTHLGSIGMNRQGELVFHTDGTETPVPTNIFKAIGQNTDFIQIGDKLTGIARLETPQGSISILGGPEVFAAIGAEIDRRNSFTYAITRGFNTALQLVTGIFSGSRSATQPPASNSTVSSTEFMLDGQRIGRTEAEAGLATVAGEPRKSQTVFVANEDGRWVNTDTGAPITGDVTLTQIEAGARAGLQTVTTQGPNGAPNYTFQLAGVVPILEGKDRDTSDGKGTGAGTTIEVTAVPVWSPSGDNQFVFKDNTGNLVPDGIQLLLKDAVTKAHGDLQNAGSVTGETFGGEKLTFRIASPTQGQNGIVR